MIEATPPAIVEVLTRPRTMAPANSSYTTITTAVRSEMAFDPCEHKGKGKVKFCSVSAVLVVQPGF